MARRKTQKEQIAVAEKRAGTEAEKVFAFILESNCDRTLSTSQIASAIMVAYHNGAVDAIDRSMHYDRDMVRDQNRERERAKAK